jgi:Domain of unknown function (DUF4258)
MRAKPIHFSGHALFEMRRRGVARSDVIRLIRSPGQVLPSVNGRTIYQNLIGPTRRFLLRVVIKEDAAYHVVTAYKTTKIAKYWRTP